MIVDERTYLLKTGQLNRYRDLYRQIGYPIQRRHLGEPLGVFTVEFGELDGWVHLWQYQDLADRVRRRAALGQDGGWREFQRQTGDLIVHRRNRLLERVTLG